MARGESVPIGNGIPIDELRAVAREVGAEVFRARYPRYFLVVQVIDVAPQAAETAKTVHAPVPGPRPSPAAVFPLSRGPAAQFDWISVGRNEGNDVFIPHASISRFHAFFRELGTTLVVQDARSSNGTFLNDARVPVQGDAPPVPVAPGSVVRFGDIPATFLAVDGLFTILTRLP